MAIVRPHASGAALAIAVLASACSRDAALPVSDETPPCLRCHGGVDPAEPARTGLALSAPPRSTLGAVDASDRGVGAHRQHLVDGTIRRAIECRECHVVPTQVEGHFGDGATVTFGGDYGRAQLPAGVYPRYDPDAPEGPSCSNVYCHGATLTGGAHVSPVWTAVNGTQRSCGSCHGYPPPWHVSLFTAPRNCNGCHPGTVLADNVTIDVAGGLHIDGLRQGPAGGSGCAACHGFPPADALHATHTSPPSATGAAYGDLHTGAGSTAGSYDFGCGECHPTTGASHFVDAGATGPDVDLLPPVPPVAGDDVKRRNDATAAYDPVSGTCTGVYCHSSGQETPVYVTTPDWRNPPAGGLGCDGCHGNPPKYASGPAGSATANSHVYLDWENWESGHFAGLPGPWHNSRHGGGNDVFAAMHGGTGTWGPNMVASPITCQTCHYVTVDGTNVLANRFFYFDTSSVNELVGLGNSSRYDDPVGTTLTNFDAWRGNQCSYCHNNVIAPAGSGKVLPALHVNGRRDVVFDPRKEYGGNLASTGLPALPGGSVLRPYYMTDAGIPLTQAALHPDAQLLASTPQVLAMHLANAAYDSSSKTCSNVSCHMLWQQQLDAGGARPLRWGGQSTLDCGYCHAQ